MADQLEAAEEEEGGGQWEDKEDPAEEGEEGEEKEEAANGTEALLLGPWSPALLGSGSGAAGAENEQRQRKQPCPLHLPHVQRRWQQQHVEAAAAAEVEEEQQQQQQQAMAAVQGEEEAALEPRYGGPGAEDETYCIECSASRPGRSRQAAWQPHLVTGEEWLCCSCHGRALQQLTRKQRQQLRQHESLAAAAVAAEEEEEEEENAEQLKCSHCCSLTTSGYWARHPATGQCLCSTCRNYMSQHGGAERPVHQCCQCGATSAGYGRKWQPHPSFAGNWLCYSCEMGMRQCRQCGARCPGTSASANWCRHPVTGAEWLCSRCYGSAWRQKKKRAELEKLQLLQNEGQRQQQEQGRQQQQRQADQLPLPWAAAPQQQACGPQEQQQQQEVGAVPQPGPQQAGQQPAGAGIAGQPGEQLAPQQQQQVQQPAGVGAPQQGQGPDGRGPSAEAMLWGLLNELDAAGAGDELASDLLHAWHGGGGRKAWSDTKRAAVHSMLMRRRGDAQRMIEWAQAAVGPSAG